MCDINKFLTCASLGKDLGRKFNWRVFFKNLPTCECILW